MIKKFQQGGKQQDAIMQFVQGLAQTLQADPQQVIQVAQQNPDALKSAVQVFQQTQDMNQAAQAFQQALQQKTQAARHGAKLNYLKSLKHQCAEDEEVVYYKKGGSVGCGCKKKMEDGGKTPKKKNNTIDNFKNRKPDQATKDSIAVNNYGAEDIEATRPGTYKKNKQGKVQWTPDRTKEPYNKENKIASIRKNKPITPVVSKNCGGAVKKFKKHYNGGSIPFMQKGTPKGGLPTAPKTEDRYAGGKRITKSGTEFGDSISIRGVEAQSPWYKYPAQIVERIRHSKIDPMFNDTTYAERPSFIKPINGVIRAAGNDYHFGKKQRYSLPLFGGFFNANYDKSTPQEQQEYDTLKRRFNTAWNLAK